MAGKAKITELKKLQGNRREHDDILPTTEFTSAILSASKHLNTNNFSTTDSKLEDPAIDAAKILTTLVNNTVQLTDHLPPETVSHAIVLARHLHDKIIVQRNETTTAFQKATETTTALEALEKCLPEIYEAKTPTDREGAHIKHYARV